MSRRLKNLWMNQLDCLTNEGERTGRNSDALHLPTWPYFGRHQISPFVVVISSTALLYSKGQTSKLFVVFWCFWVERETVQPIN